MLPNLLLLNICLHIAEGYNVISSGQPNRQNSPTKIQNILCSADSNAIHFLIIDKETGDEISDIVEWLNKDCSFKTVQLSAIFPKQTTLPYHAYHSEVTVFIVNFRQSIQYFVRTVSQYQKLNRRHHRFIVVFKFQYNLQALQNEFKNLARKSVFNIVVMVNDGLEESIFLYSPFNGMFNFFNDAVTTGEDKEIDVFACNRSDLRGKSLVVSMHEQEDRAILRLSGRPGYSGIDGLIADLLEER